MIHAIIMAWAVGKGIIHSDATKIRCAYLYAEHGNYSKVARDTRIHRISIMNWAKSSDVWHEALDKARQEISSELLAQNLAIATRANEEVMDRINNGDTKVVSSRDAKGKYHETIKVPMTGKDLAVVSGIKEDKARVAMGQASVIKADSSSQQSMLKFLEQISDTYREKNKNVVSVQDKE